MHYKVVNSHFANNRRLAGSGTGARLEYHDIDPSFLELVGTTETERPVTLEGDSTKRASSTQTAGSDASKVGAGLFVKAAV